MNEILIMVGPHHSELTISSNDTNHKKEYKKSHYR